MHGRRHYFPLIAIAGAFALEAFAGPAPPASAPAAHPTPATSPAFDFGPASAPSNADQTGMYVAPCVADSVVMTANGQPELCNLGAGREMTIQGPYGWALMQFDLGPVANRRITRARLRIHRAKYYLIRASVSTVSTPQQWAEGTQSEPKPQIGAACFRFAAYGPGSGAAVLPWARPGSSLAHVTFGYGGSRWATTAIRYETDTGWYELDVPPALVQAMASGVQAPALVLADDFNRSETVATIHSRESVFPPALIIQSEPLTSTPSAAPTKVTSSRDDLGREWLEFEAPESLAFDVVLSADRPGADGPAAKFTRMPMYDLPTPGAGRLRALLSRVREPSHRFVSVRARDVNGAWSPYVSAELPRPLQTAAEFSIAPLPRYDLPKEIRRSFAMDAAPSISEDGRWIRSAARSWWDPFKGPIQLESAGNEHTGFQVVLAGEPGEYAVTATAWEFSGASAVTPVTQFYRENFVRSRLGRDKYCPDPFVPLPPNARLKLDFTTRVPAASQPASSPAGDADDNDHDIPEAAAATTQSAAVSQSATSAPAAESTRFRVVQPIYVETYVPRGVSAGVWKCRLIALRNGIADLDIPVELTVLPGALPDTLNFPVLLRNGRPPLLATDEPTRQPGEPNLPPASAPVERTVDADAWRQYQRLAHAHRLTFAPMPYSTDGTSITNAAPHIQFSAGQLDWRDWDERFAGLFDGGWLRDLPRGGVPVDCAITPIRPGWPARFAPMTANDKIPLVHRYHYRTLRTEPDYSARPNPRPEFCVRWPLESAVNSLYFRALEIFLPAYRKHFSTNPAVGLLVWLTMDVGGVENGGGWVLDRPETIDDASALAWFYRQIRKAAAAGDSGPPLRMVTPLGDLFASRDVLAGQTDIVVVDGRFTREHDAVFSRPDLFPRIWFDLGKIDPEYGWSKAFAMGWAARLAGAEGVVIRESLAPARAWEVSYSTAWMYPATAENMLPAASGRLKSLRRLQEDFEWLELYLQTYAKKGVPRGYSLSSIALRLVEAGGARALGEGHLLPVVGFPGRIDGVTFEELRRGLRRAALADSASSR